MGAAGSKNLRSTFRNPMVFTLGEQLQPFREELRDHLVVAIPERVQRLILRWRMRSRSFPRRTGRG